VQIQWDTSGIVCIYQHLPWHCCVVCLAFMQFKSWNVGQGVPSGNLTVDYACTLMPQRTGSSWFKHYHIVSRGLYTFTKPITVAARICFRQSNVANHDLPNLATSQTRICFILACAFAVSAAHSAHFHCTLPSLPVVTTESLPHHRSVHST
jgi:hypothetical protein